MKNKILLTALSIFTIGYSGKHDSLVLCDPNKEGGNNTIFKKSKSIPHKNNYYRSFTFTGDYTEVEDTGCNKKHIRSRKLKIPKTPNKDKLQNYMDKHHLIHTGVYHITCPIDSNNIVVMSEEQAQLAYEQEPEKFESAIEELCLISDNLDIKSLANKELLKDHLDKLEKGEIEEKEEDESHRPFRFDYSKMHVMYGRKNPEDSVSKARQIKFAISDMGNKDISKKNEQRIEILNFMFPRKDHKSVIKRSTLPMEYYE